MIIVLHETGQMNKKQHEKKNTTNEQKKKKGRTNSNEQRIWTVSSWKLNQKKSPESLH